MNVTMPFIISGGPSHSAAEQDICELCTKLIYETTTCHAYATRWNLYSRLHSGGGIDGYVAEFTFTCVHVVVLIPIISKPKLQV